MATVLFNFKYEQRQQLLFALFKFQTTVTRVITQSNGHLSTTYRKFNFVLGREEGQLTN